MSPQRKLYNHLIFYVNSNLGHELGNVSVNRKKNHVELDYWTGF